MRSVLEIGGRRMPMLRWSAVRMMLGMRRLTREWQVGDGREAACLEYVLQNARAGDAGDVIDTIDEFCATRSVLINVGDEKGEILDRAVERCQPRLLLELGAYCGYSALRMARAMPPNARVVSVEYVQANAEIARGIWEHAGVDDGVTAVVGWLGDGGTTIARLREEFGFSDGAVDLVFVDHDKEQYVPDLERILGERWLHAGSVVVADNVKMPGAPAYRAFMDDAEGKTWRTTEHETHLEYQSLLKDVVLESEYLGASA
jgi:catechol O-methyltransferase